MASRRGAALAIFLAVALLGAGAAMRIPQKAAVSTSSGHRPDRQVCDGGAAIGDALLAAAAELVEHQGIWLNDKVRLQWRGPDRGCVIIVVAPVARGELLLRGNATSSSAVSSELPHRWESNDFGQFCDMVENSRGSTPGAVRLVVRLTNLLLNMARRNRTGGDGLGPLERYISACMSDVGPPSQWPADARALLEGSAMRAEADRDADLLRREAIRFQAAWPEDAVVPAPSAEEFRAAWARADLLASTRGFQTFTGLNAIFCPVLDLVNHASSENSNALYDFNDKQFFLKASKDIAAGTEAMVDYDFEADFLFIWSRYGFFDETATIHRVEVVVPSGAVNEAHTGGVYSIPGPDAPIECTLLDELTQVARWTLLNGDSRPDLEDPEVRQEALRRFAELIRAHLEAYPRDAGAPTVGERDELERFRRVASAVVRYEKWLLKGTLTKVETLLGNIPNKKSIGPAAT